MSQHLALPSDKKEMRAKIAPEKRSWNTDFSYQFVRKSEQNVRVFVISKQSNLFIFQPMQMTVLAH